MAPAVIVAAFQALNLSKFKNLSEASFKNRAKILVNWLELANFTTGKQPLPVLGSEIRDHHCKADDELYLTNLEVDSAKLCEMLSSAKC
jgi:hypothetical protein